MKRCCICKEERELNEFSKNKSKKDGHNNMCRICQKEYYLLNREQRKEKMKQYVQRNKEKIREYKNQYRKQSYHRNPEKHKARHKLNNAVRRGKIHKPLYCSSCDSDKHLEAHHTDYSKPLEVLWLCRTCHVELHNRIRNKQIKRRVYEKMLYL